MPGAIEIDADTIRPITRIAYKDNSGRWRAGPDNRKGLAKGQFISRDYAQKATTLRRRTNSIKQIMRNNDMSETEARNHADKLFREIRNAENEEERRDIWKAYVNS